MEMKNPNSSNNDHFHLPPGFRFHPSDEELIVYYLRNKITSNPLPSFIIADIDLYKYNPWQLPKKAYYGEEEWYFFSPRKRKYPNGTRPNRAAGSGYWKATGSDKPILTSCGTKSIGVKKALVFYNGRAPKGVKTDWIMHEYRLIDQMNKSTFKQNGHMRLDDWVLCRVRQKRNILRNTWEDENVCNYITPTIGHVNGAENKSSCYTASNPDLDHHMVANFIYKDFPILPNYIPASQVLRNCIQAPNYSHINFQDGDHDGGKSFTSYVKENPECILESHGGYGFTISDQCFTQ